MRLLRPSFIVGIGGSAGGLAAYEALLSAMRFDTGMAFVIVAHMSPDRNSLLPDILCKYTEMVVLEAQDGILVERDHVYVIPPNADLLIEAFTFKVVSPRTMGGGKHKQVDFFLNSFAKAMGEHAVGVILSGYDGDGTEGCLCIKSQGGKTFAQDMSAIVGSMPLHARASGSVDYVLPPDKIAEKLTALSHAERERVRGSVANYFPPS